MLKAGICLFLIAAANFMFSYNKIERDRCDKPSKAAWSLHNDQFSGIYHNCLWVHRGSEEPEAYIPLWGKIESYDNILDEKGFPTGKYRVTLTNGSIIFTDNEKP